MKEEKVWVVTLTQDTEVTQASVFDNGADADNYAQEMNVSGRGHYQVLCSVLSRRNAVSESEKHMAGLPEFDTTCIECLAEDLSGVVDSENIDHEACAKYFENNKENLQKKADKIVHEYLRKELHDYLMGERTILG